MHRSGRYNHRLSPLTACLLILALLMGQAAAAMHTGLPPLPACPDSEHSHHHDIGHDGAYSYAEAPSDHHDHHASGGVECPCLLCAGSAISSTTGDYPFAPYKTAVPPAQTNIVAASSRHWLRPLLRAPPLTVRA